MLDAGTRTWSNTISACPCGASSYPKTVSMRVIVTPGAAIGTRSIDCCRHRAAHDFAQRRVFHVGQTRAVLALWKKEIPQAGGARFGLQRLDDPSRLPPIAVGDLAPKDRLVRIDVLVHERHEAALEIVHL